MYCQPAGSRLFPSAPTLACASVVGTRLMQATIFMRLLSRGLATSTAENPLVSRASKVPVRLGLGKASRHRRRAVPSAVLLAPTACSVQSASVAPGIALGALH